MRANEAHPRSSLNDLSGTPADRLIEAQSAVLDLDWAEQRSAFRRDRFALRLGLGRPGRVAGTRELVIPRTPYIVPYRVTGDVVQIITILHSAQLPGVLRRPIRVRRM